MGYINPKSFFQKGGDMSLQKVPILPYHVRIHYHEEILFEGYIHLPAGVDAEETIKNDLKKLRQTKGVDIHFEHFSVNAREVGWMELFPIFDAIRYCHNCDLTSREAGVSDEHFVHCGHCGKKTYWILQKAKKQV